MLKIQKSQCNGCHACMEICPKKCIKMMQDDEGFLYPHIDNDKCINCGKCEKVCCNVKLSKDNPYLESFAAYSCDEELKKNSSSGGIFSVIAEHILKNCGVVFGAAFDEKFSVYHTYIDKVEDLDKIRRSKYVQSRIGTSFSNAKGFLESNQLVLFVGTPCQIGGLKSYLGKDYENLITCDFICHGVPSPLCFQKYLNESTFGKKINSISFRDKTHGWKVFSMDIYFEDSTKYNNELTKDPFLSTLLQDVMLRPSCYNCAYKGIDRVSDITLADFWGIDKVVKNFNDNTGVSAVIIHSKNGKMIFNAISESIKFKNVDVKNIVDLNPSIIHSVKYKPLRKYFMAKCINSSFMKAFNMYCSDKISAKVRRKLISKIGL